MKKDNLKSKKTSQSENQNKVNDACKIAVPKDLENIFANLMNLVPIPYRYEKDIQQTVLKYLKLGGEELVRIVIESSKEEFSQIKRSKLKSRNTNDKGRIN